MKFYQVETDVGPQLVTRKDEAKRLDKNFRAVDIPTDSEGLRLHLNALMAIAAQVDDSTSEVIPAGADAPVEMAPSYTHQSVALDDAWEELSLSRKLHFGALAMEAARDKL